MQISSLKSTLIGKIIQIEDEHLLMEASRLIDVSLPDQEERYIFSKEQTDKIMFALKQIENGKYLSAEEANNEIEQWLKK
jgi:hypothetical protein